MGPDNLFPAQTQTPNPPPPACAEGLPPPEEGGGRQGLGGGMEPIFRGASTSSWESACFQESELTGKTIPELRKARENSGLPPGPTHMPAPGLPFPQDPMAWQEITQFLVLQFFSKNPTYFIYYCMWCVCVCIFLFQLKKFPLQACPKLLKTK